MMRFLGNLSLIFLVASTAVTAENRTWSDRSGKLRVEAEFVSCVDGLVKLRKPDGSEANIPLKMLSESDRTYVDAIVEQLESPDTVSHALAQDPPIEAPAIGPRLWTERASQRQLEATFVELRDDVVVVRLPEGRVAQVPLERLNDADREYVRQVSQRPEAASGDIRTEHPHRKTQRFPLRYGTTGPTPDSAPVPKGNLFDILRDKFALDRFDSWYRFPRIAYLLGAWFGLATLTGVFAAILRRSFFGWFVLGLLLPGIAPLIPPFVGKRRELFGAMHAISLGAMRVGTVLTSFLGLRGVADLASQLDSFTSAATAMDLLVKTSLLVIATLVGIWILNTAFATMVATLLQRSVLRWWAVSLFLPFVGSGVLALFASRSQNVKVKQARSADSESLVEFLMAGTGSDRIYQVLRTRSVSEIEDLCRTIPIESLRLEFPQLDDIRRFELVTFLARILTNYDAIRKKSPNLALPASLPADRLSETLLRRLVPFIERQDIPDQAATVWGMIYELAMAMIQADLDEQALVCLLKLPRSAHVTPQRDFWIASCRCVIAQRTRSPSQIAAGIAEAERFLRAGVSEPAPHTMQERAMLAKLKGGVPSGIIEFTPDQQLAHVRNYLGILRSLSRK